MSENDLITHDELLTLLDYSPETGVFTWLQRVGNIAIVGCRAGGYEAEGYRRIKIKRRTYKEHRLAWFYFYGAWPTKDIDHINGCKDDNRIDNLREATQKENHQNRKSNKNSTSKYLGVSLDTNSGKYKVGITVNQKRTHIGYFANEEDAYAAYCEAKKKLHPFNPKPLPALELEQMPVYQHQTQSVFHV